MRKKTKTKLLILVIGVLIVGVSFFNRKDIRINYVLSQSSYSYLPSEAKKYIEDVYKETGNIILTEKNKNQNELYLNPIYVDYLTYTDEEKQQVSLIPSPTIVDYYTRDSVEDVELPSKYDLRNDNGNNYVTPVRDQGNLGLCWAFATAGSLESHLLKTTNTSYSPTSLLITERQIDYVTSKNSINGYKSEYVSFIDRSLGDGGNFYISTIALANGVSAFDYNSFKEYNDKDSSRMELSDVISYDKSLYEVNSTVNFPQLNLRESTSILTDEEKETRNNYLNEIKQNVMKNGALYVSTFTNSTCLYNDTKLDNTIIDVYNCSLRGGHAMQIIGWDDDINYSYCADTKSHSTNISSCTNVVSGKGVWILKNSWGESTQYPYLTYDSMYTAVNFITEVQSSEDQDWDNNYVLGTEAENVKSQTYTLSNTKIKGDEKLEKIKFITSNVDAVYNVKIKKKDGTYEVLSKKSDLPGLITVDVTSDIIVDKNTEIVIYSDKTFIDKVSFFTSNIDVTPSIDLSKYDNLETSDKYIRLYAETKNIPSGTLLEYKIYNSNNVEITDKATFTHNEVAENNVNTLLTLSEDIAEDNYRIDVIYNSNVLTSTNIKILLMTGLGSKNNPYIITNSTQLSQIRDDLDAYYELANDIDLTADTHEGGKLSIASNACPQGFGWEAINGFSGSLNGNGHTIKGLYQNNYLECDFYEGVAYTREWNNNGNGLFGSLTGSPTIENLVLEDFDINCQGGYCGALVSSYFDDSDYVEETDDGAVFRNIVLRNSKINGVYNGKNSSDKTNVFGGGLFGKFDIYNNRPVLISNIYLDFKIENGDLEKIAYLLSLVEGKDVSINNIQIKGNFEGRLNGESRTAVLIYNAFDFDDVTEKYEIKNVLSTVTGTNIGSFINGSSETFVNNFNALNINNTLLCKNCFSVENVNLFDINTEIYKLTDKNNYSTWENFDDNWVIKTVDGIPRIPILKFVDFEYTKINDISIKQELNKYNKIYDFIEPNIEPAKRILYKSNNENIVKIDDNGVIIPQATGSTTIHVESYYDGYIKDVPISVVYKPHYTIHFDSNGLNHVDFLGREFDIENIEGTMESFEVDVLKDAVLPENKFTQSEFEVVGWNTKPDGTGTSYENLSTIPGMKDKEEITLYAQWLGKKKVVTLNPNGGTVNPDKIEVRYYGPYENLPIPVKPGYAFECWLAKGGMIIDAFTPLSHLELNADWIEDAYTIIFDANGGTVQDEFKYDYDLYLVSNSLATTYAKNGQAKEIYKNIYEKSGYVFKEWNTKADGTGVAYSPSDTLTMSDVENSTFKLYAIWEKEKYSVSFDANGGMFSNNNNIITIEEFDDTKLNTIEKPTREGYVFKGYFTEKENGISLEDYIKNNGINKNDLVFYAQWESDFKYSINNYSVDETNKYISKIMINTEVNNFKTNIQLGTGYGVDVDYKTINGKNVLYTGGKTKITKDSNVYVSYTNAVIGDLNGDGKINSADLLRVRQHLLNKNILSGVYFLAGDINYDNKINSADLLRIRQHLLGKKPIV